MDTKIIQKLDKKIEKIIQKGKFFNLIERFYYYSIKLNQLNKLGLNEAIEDIASSFAPLQISIMCLEEQIKSSYGLNDLRLYKFTKKTTILNNPNLLGISPFLFKYEWFDYLKNDLDKYDSYCEDEMFTIIENSLDDALYRLDLKVFPSCLFVIEPNENFTAKYLKDLLFYSGRPYDPTNQEIIDFKEQKKNQFTESEMFKNSIKSKIQINLSFELADKVFKKYFEINFTEERCHKIYPDFRIFLNVLFNKASMESENKTIGLEEEEVKKMIGFFSCYKATKTSPNIFTYEVVQLVKLMERISGLPAKTTWEKAHRDNKYKIAKNLEKEINSIIPEKSAVKK